MDTDTNETAATQAANGAERQPRGTVTRDAETTALVRIFKTLDELDDTARRRVVNYIADKYEGDIE